MTTEDQPAAAPFSSAAATDSHGNGATVEQALYALLFVLALGLRLYSLGDLNPVSPLEAAQIWPAWVDQSAGTPEERAFPEPRHSSHFVNLILPSDFRLNDRRAGKQPVPFLGERLHCGSVFKLADNERLYLEFSKPLIQASSEHGIGRGQQKRCPIQ